MAKVLHEAFGIERGFMTTVHAYTGPEPARRAAPGSQACPGGCHEHRPYEHRSAQGTALVLPELRGKLDGIAMRVPVATGSVIDLVVDVSRETTVGEVSSAFRAAAQGGLRDVLVYTEDPIVSSDIVTSPASCTFDAQLTMAAANRVKVIDWYEQRVGLFEPAGGPRSSRGIHSVSEEWRARARRCPQFQRQSPLNDRVRV